MSSSNHDISTEPIYIVANSLSIVGCMLIFYRAYRIPTPITTALKLVILLGLSDFVASLFNIISITINVSDRSCQFIGFVKAIATWTSLFWCSSISLLAYLSLSEIGRVDISKIFRVVIACVSIIAILIAVLPFTHEAGLEYADIDHFCRTNYKVSGFTYDKLFFFLILRGLGYFIAVSITVFAYIKMLSFYRTLPKDLRRILNLSSRKLLVYPAIQLFIYTPNVVYSLVAIWTDYQEPWLLIVSSWSSLAGFVNFLVYGQQFLSQYRSQKQSRLNSGDPKADELSRTFNNTRLEDSIYVVKNRRESNVLADCSTA